MKILKRAWSILWSYRALWIFGVLLAITSGGSGGNGGGNGANFNFDQGDFNNPNWPRGDFWRGLERMFDNLFSAEMIGTWIAIGVGVLCLVLLLAVLARIVYYVSHVALIRMVDEHERSGEKLGFRQGWRLGWSRPAWRLFLIDLLIYLPVIVLVLLMLGCGVTFFVGSGVIQGSDPGAGWIAGMIGFILLIILLLFIVGILVSLVQSIIRRYAVLENAGVIDAIRGGLGLIRRRLVDVFLMWLILVGLTIAYTVALIPVALILLAVAALLGGGLGMAAYFGLQAVAGEGAAIVAALILALPAFLVILVAPLTFVEGLRQVYGSTVWTLAYRELSAAQPAPAEASAPLEPSAGAGTPGGEC